MGSCCGQRAENKQMTIAPTQQDHTWSGPKMEGDNSLNTIECLRGRLLAERQASRVAKEEEESLANKSIELEMKLREEIKLRHRAERKLNFLKMKLESLNMYSPSGQSEHSYPSEKCENSRGSPSCNSAHRQSEANETKLHTTNPALLESAVHNHCVAQASVLIQSQNSPSTYDDCGSQYNALSNYKSNLVYWLPEIQCKNPKLTCENLKNDEYRLSRSSSKSSAKSYNSKGNDDYSSNPNSIHASLENICHDQNSSYENLKIYESRLSGLRSQPSMTEDEDDHGDFVDNSLALVPETWPSTSHATINLKPVNENVDETLEALRRAKEWLLCSMGERPMIIKDVPT